MTENKLKNLLELKKQVEADYRNATKEQIRILKEYSWAIGEIKIKGEENEKETRK